MALNERTRAETVLAKLISLPQISLPSLAAAMDVPPQRLKGWAYGRAPFPAEHAPDLYRAVAEVDPSLALWAYSEIVGLPLIRHEARPTLAGCDPDPIHVDALQAGAALGRVEGLVADAGSEVDAMEAAEMLPDLRRAHLEIEHALVKVEATARRTNQTSLALGAP